MIVKQINKYIVITRPLEDVDNFSDQIKKLGLQVFLYPTIMIQKNILKPKDREQLKNLNDFDWILFTSKNGVLYLKEYLTELGQDLSALKLKKIGVVGTKTAEQVKKYALQVNFTPSQFTTEDLARELPNVKGKKILMPRADIANSQAEKILERRGATVVNLPIYSTKYLSKPNVEFEKLLNKEQIMFITFTSPSTVKGLFNILKDLDLKKKVLNIPAVSIGPVTSKIVKKFGFKTMYTADTFTTLGMLKKLKEITL